MLGSRTKLQRTSPILRLPHTLAPPPRTATGILSEVVPFAWRWMACRSADPVWMANLIVGRDARGDDARCLHPETDQRWARKSRAERRRREWTVCFRYNLLERLYQTALAAPENFFNSTSAP